MAFFNEASQTSGVKFVHSEYRSTYKWHEFSSKSGLGDVVKNPPLSSNGDFHFMRKKKHPDVAYKSHEFFDMSLAPEFPLRSHDTLDGKQEPRENRRHKVMAQRRAQSEGPGIRNPLFRDDGNDIRPVPTKGAQASVAPVHTRKERSTATKEGTLHADDKKTQRQNGFGQSQMKESHSMGQILSESEKGLSTSAKAVNDEKTSEGKPRRRQYSSEYRKSFRPFSQYEYIDGKFIPSCGFNFRSVANANKAASLHGEPWYQEVIELRKQALDYKCRGWGTETISSTPSCSQYSKQLELYEQASRRESLSALSLALSAPRPSQISKEASPTKSLTSHRPSRPRTAPPARTSSAKSSRSESVHPVSEAAAATSGVRAPSAVRKSRDQVDASKSNVAKVTRARSPSKRPPSASTVSSSVAPSPGPEPELNGTGGKAAKRQRPTTLNTATSSSQKTLSHKPPARQETTSTDVKDQFKVKRNQTEKEGSVKAAPSSVSAQVPHEAATTAASCHSIPSATARRPFSRSSSKTGGVAGSRDPSRPPSAIENNIDYFREPVVKSPPEPTRVKSPEGIIRSPDPINWTVPLDTTKTFSVTQSIRDGDSARNSPLSDHSSLLDSVSGTAINLGRHHHQPKISSLAKEAILQPGLTKDSTLTKVSNCHDLHQNPSIPEVAEENTSKDPSPSNHQQQQNGSDHMNGETAKNSPGMKLKCLEDPSFEFEPKKPSYRVLEDPTNDEKNILDSTTKPARTAGPYRVLEDPMMASIYDAGPHSSRPMASEVLEGARERFDKFWSGKSKEAPGES